MRADLRRTIREIQRELGVTTLFVTHDQEEAFELADRLAVLSFGRLLEAGPPEELYLRPETEFVATFLGTANLLVGEATPQGVRVGPVCFPLGTHAERTSADTTAARRVQVLFRPEDVAVRDSAEEASFPLLGQAVVDQRAFIGSFERLRLRLPALPGVRAIAPVVPFGSDSIWIEATRSQDQARRFPLQTGDTTWVGVRRVHALVHPGLRFLLLTDGSAPSRAALALGGELARLAHARVAVLAPGTEPGEDADRRLQEAREQLGSGVASLESRTSGEATRAAVAEETSRRPCDLVVLGTAPRDGVKLAEDVISAGQHHLLLVPPEAPGRAPERWLICVAVGEPGKADVSFAGRLARHLRAEATILTVLPETARLDDAPQAERFLAGSARTLARMGIQVTTRIRYGRVRAEILAQLRDGGHDLLVMGSPLPGQDGEIELKGVVSRLLPELPGLPLLIVRSPEGAS